MSLSLLSSRRFFARNSTYIQRSFSSCQTQWRDFVETPATPRAPLEGIRVLDLTRVLGRFYQNDI